MPHQLTSPVGCSLVSSLPFVVSMWSRRLRLHCEDGSSSIAEVVEVAPLEEEEEKEEEEEEEDE